jgi:hypothetical protein
MRGIAAALVLGAVALGAAASTVAPAPVQDPADDSRTLGRFLFFATLEGLCEDGLPDRSVAAVLEQDEKGRYRNFVYACPVCSPVLEGFRAYAIRHDKIYYSRKGDPLVGDPSPAIAAVVEGLASPEAMRRGRALDAFVRRCVERRMERLRFRDEEKQGMRIRLEEGRKKGMEALPSSEGFQFKSCPSCDGANGEDWKDK